LLGVQSVETPLDRRLTNDFLHPLTNSLTNSLSKRKSRKYKSKRRSSSKSPLSLVRTRSKHSSLRRRK
jgi:hypothetical protein